MSHTFITILLYYFIIYLYLNSSEKGLKLTKIKPKAFSSLVVVVFFYNRKVYLNQGWGTGLTRLDSSSSSGLMFTQEAFWYDLYYDITQMQFLGNGIQNFNCSTCSLKV